MSNQPSTWQKFCNSVEGRNSTRQLAAGVALGMLIGLMPKDSLLLLATSVVLILSPANLLSAAISALAFSFISSIPAVNFAMHSLGSWVIGHAFVEDTIRNWWSAPLVAWTRINNSIVVGAIALWSVLLIPAYLISGTLFERFGNRIYHSIRESSSVCWLIGAKKTKLNEG